MDPTPQKSIVLPILLSILGTGLTVGGVAYYYGMSQSSIQPTTVVTSSPVAKTTSNPSPSPSVSPTVVDTSNWRTYSDTQYNFSYKYPPEWEVKKTNPADSYGAVVTLTSPQTKKDIENAIKRIGYCEGCGADASVYYYATIADEDSNKSKEYKAKTIEELITQDKGNKVLLGTTTINGLKAVEVQELGITTDYALYIEKDGHLYKISFSNRGNKSGLSPEENQILTNFKFTK